MLKLQTQSAEPAAHYVRRAGWNDLDALIQFSLALCRETEGRQLDPEVVRAGVRQMLANPACLIFVAENEDGRVVGEIMIGGHEWSDWSNGQFWWVTSVYVRPEARRRGVGRALYAKIREQARLASPKVIGIRGYVKGDNAVTQEALNSLGRHSSGQMVFEERFGAAA